MEDEPRMPRALNAMEEMEVLQWFLLCFENIML